MYTAAQPTHRQLVELQRADAAQRELATGGTQGSGRDEQRVALLEAGGEAFEAQLGAAGGDCLAGREARLEGVPGRAGVDGLDGLEDLGALAGAGRSCSGSCWISTAGRRP